MTGQSERPPRYALQTLLILFLFLFLIPFPLLAQSPPASHIRSLLVWNPAATGADSLDQLAWERIFTCLGLHPERTPGTNPDRLALDSTTTLVVPHASARVLSPRMVQRIVNAVEGGLNLVSDGITHVTTSFGIRPRDPLRVGEVTDHWRPEIRITWPRRPSVDCIAAYPAKESTIIYSDARTGSPLGIVVQRGKGRCLFLAPLADPLTGRGYARFASLPSVLVEGLGCRPLLTRNCADAYFDPGYRAGVPPEKLAGMWRQWGIRGVHVAAWYASGDPPYDYRGLIDALHRNGIRAYAWLEWPYIGKGFWDRHPEWRQKNSLLQDAHLDFLYLMDLQNPECMNTALKELDDLLDEDWDGVDVAEFTLTGAGREALEGPAMPEFFTGFTDFGRSEFSRQKGFDPIELFSPQSQHFWKADTAGLKSFFRYRTDVNFATERRLFSELRNVDREKSRSRELMLTIVDNMHHPEFDDLLGFDLGRTAAVAKEFGVTIDIEDPYTEWTKPPERYIALGASYQRLLGDSPFMTDINVVPMEQDRQQDFSTAQAAGTEFLQLWKCASEATGRVCFYCESSVYEGDWKLLPFAMAQGANATPAAGSFIVDAPSTVLLRGPGAKGGAFLDDRPWPAVGDSEAIVPAGHHTIRFAGEGADSGRISLTSISGELLDAAWIGEDLVVDEQSPGRCALGFNRVPVKVLVDNEPTQQSITHTGTGCVVLCPPGRHRVTVSVP